VDLSQPGVELEGFVSDVRTAYRRAEIVLAPLTASAGTNIKVLEAMAMGRAIVSTPAGVNGFDFANGRDLIVVESPEAMAKEILRLSADAEARTKIEAKAREAALKYGWEEIALAQAELYERLGQA
jgi:glycosyltransferase involved in cell wall biosynthesis